MNNIFTSNVFKNIIYKNVIINTFPSLNTHHSNLLFNYLINILSIIQIQFCITDDDLYIKQICQHDYKDIRGILFILLPYINNDGDISKIKSFNDIYIKKQKNIDVNISQPTYVYSNLQYNRCIRNKNDIREILYSDEHLDHNYKLLIETIKIISNKLCINWLNVVPYNMKTFMESKLYKNTNENIIYERYQDDVNNCLYIGDIYNVCANDFYNNVKNIKWLFFNYTENTKKINYENDKIIDYISIFNNQYPLIIILNKILPLTECFNGMEWKNLDKLTQKLFQSKLENLKKTETITLNDIIIKRANIDEILKSIYKCYAKKNYMKDYKENTLNKFYNLSHVVIYNIIKESINEMKHTWYGYYLFDYDNKCIKKENSLFNNIPIKYIYNFSKSLCHEFDADEKKKLPSFWSSLDNQTRKKTINNLNNKNSNWFNVTRIIQFTCNVDRNTSIKINSFLYDKIRKMLMEGIFENLILKGVLTQFEPNVKYSDIGLKNNSLLKNYLTNIRLNDVNLLKYSYNYLTNTTHEKMGNYVRDTLTNNNWHIRYTFDWITQIKVYHHFINNRVIYLTGTTGIGKSTQIPKLFLYALKMIQYNNNGKMLITVPRIKPLIESANFVSKELGVPIKNNNNDDINDNYNVQYKYKNTELSHFSDKYGLILRFVTDGIFLNDIINNINLKNKINDVQTTNNLYDIIMIDESHEHNTNMDIILSLIKFSLHVNNNIKLIISSATMDNDECTYRRFYRDINDNGACPLSMIIKEKRIDRINTDRRLHIEQPNVKFPNAIMEINKPSNVIDENDENSTIKIVMKIIMEIIKSNSIGDILLFQIGQKEIESLILHINKNTPPDTIAIPLYSKLEGDANIIMTDFNNYRNLINISKNDDFNDISIEEMSHQTKFTAYKRFIIVATNIAEASITIPSIKYVIDTGKQKISKYDYRSDKTKLVTSKISNVSRIQRKGRVGRTSAGTIYYLYNIQSLNDEPIMCNIMIEDISLNLFSLLNENKIDEISNTNDNDYVGIDEHYDYVNMENIYDIYKSGINKVTLDDINGVFYIIHPDEIYFTRNLSGKIIEKDNQCLDLNNESLKINAFWNKLKNYQLLDNNYHKTYFGLYYSEYLNIFDFPNIEIRHIISYIFSKKYNCSDIFIKLLFLLSVMNNKITSLYGLYPYYKNKNNYGDIKLLIDIILLFDTLNLNKIKDDDDISFVYFCNKNNLNSDIMFKYIELYMELPILMDKINELDNKHKNFIDGFCAKNIFKHNIYENIILSLSHGFFNNIVFRYGKYPNVIQITQPYIDNIYNIPQYKNVFLTSLNNHLVNDFLLYLGFNDTTNIISIIIKIDKHILNKIKYFLKIKYDNFHCENIYYDEQHKQYVKNSYINILNNIAYAIKN